jgi:pimeloyl-ACP methyl ester carboxylesterase
MNTPKVMSGMGATISAEALPYDRRVPLSRWRVAAATALAVTALLAACSPDHAARFGAALQSGSAASTAADSSDASPAGSASSDGNAGIAPLEWRSCGGRLKCASLDVPLDYTNPGGKHIKLSLDELPARKGDERIGPLLVNPGGPGASGLEFASGIPLPSDVLDRFDIIGFDPRGVGESTAIDCGNQTVPDFRRVDSTPDTAQEQDELDTAAKAVADDCGAHAADLLAHIGTDDVARDMDSIRQALGAPQISYYGASYGTLIGERYLALFPRNARAVVLDGVVDPRQGFTEFLRAQAVAFDAQLNTVFDQCASGSSCPPGGARAAYDTLAAQVETHPVSTRTGNALGPAELPVAALLPAYDPSAAPIFYRGLTEALNGDGSTLYSLFESYEQSGSYPDYAGVECTDSPHPDGADAYRSFAADLETVSARLGGSIANELLPCAFWPVPIHDVTGPVAAPDGPPVLVVGNTKDAATPYQQAVDVAQMLAHGRLLTLDGAGHTALGRSDCIAAAESTYLVELQLPADGTVCSP